MIQLLAQTTAPASEVSPMVAKLVTLGPEMILLAAAFASMLLGLSPSRWMRRGTICLCGTALIAAGALALVQAQWPAQWGLPVVGPIASFIKIIGCGVGLLLLLAVAEVPDEQPGQGDEVGRFDPAVAWRGEFFGFFLLSLVGLMLTAGADDLIWLFLALELTSLPTYVMVALSRDRSQALEAGVKYFFLGAMSAALFGYGFALIYGAAGSTAFGRIAGVFAMDGVSSLALLGLCISVVGISFKIAAAPMHFYAADVYQGAASPVTAFLAFVPKAAGFVALVSLLNTVGWPLDRGAPALVMLIGAMAAVTMTVGNTLALLQTNVKRVLAYSSIAHSGYMLVGLAAGPVFGPPQSPFNGIGAVFFYLASYGVMNLGAFAVLGMLRRRGEEAQTFDDLRGLIVRSPILASVMAVCCLSLTGIPPLVGFWGKVFLFGAAVSVDTTPMLVLVVIAVINSAIGATYYLRIIGYCFSSDAVDPEVVQGRLPARWIGAVLAGVGVLGLSVGSGPLVVAGRTAASRIALREAPAKLVEQPQAQASTQPKTAQTQPKTQPAQVSEVAQTQAEEPRVSEK